MGRLLLLAIVAATVQAQQIVDAVAVISMPSSGSSGTRAPKLWPFVCV